MRISSVARIWLLAAPLLVPAVPALAQVRPPTDSIVNYGGMLAKKPPAPTLPDVPAPPSAWPRLDPGAVLCRGEGDLRRRAALMRGEQAGPADCQPITVPTAIQIVRRAGPGATEVRLTGRDETGWTDAWLPATPPPGSTPVNAGRLMGSRAEGSR
ncbi:MAG TPA: hypothetical protein VND19_05005 [Acetobacteraceae bacterium]|nr:hypothetical protein [Acetobacteraceae bacterium]